ncbi:MAG: DUF5320 domain-containing protein [Candidatus Pacebacteria bacterium]|nr:DUF5320 domain-containing protein [Candidatus Paceibacterota bacterium]
MPRFDGTGPMGYGPGTGWGLGPCGGGMAYGRRGFGRFWRFGPQVTKKEEQEMLEQEVGILESELKSIKERLAEIKDQKN